MKNNRNPVHDRMARTARRLARESAVNALRDGRKIRSVTFANRKKQANKRACRGRVEYAR